MSPTGAGTTRLWHRVARGVAAGAVGTTALNATTHLDMTVRGRPASRTPQQSAERLAAMLRVPLPEDQDRRESVLTGLGALLGTSAGLAAGVAVELLQPGRGPVAFPRVATTAFAVAMTAGNGPMVVLGITDPRTWTPADWAADVLPHAAYALAAAALLTRR